MEKHQDFKSNPQTEHGTHQDSNNILHGPRKDNPEVHVESSRDPREAKRYQSESWRNLKSWSKITLTSHGHNPRWRQNIESLDGTKTYTQNNGVQQRFQILTHTAPVLWFLTKMAKIHTVEKTAYLTNDTWLCTCRKWIDSHLLQCRKIYSTLKLIE